MLAKLRKQFAEFWDKQSQAQRMMLIALGIAALVIIPVLISWANTPSYAIAFNGLTDADAGQIVEKLDEAGIPYKLQGSGSILVPSDQVYDVRLRMARDGLPETESVGFELFSGNTLGMTDFSQRVNYQNALEGELERTIGSLESVEAVRVHVVTPERSLLSSAQAKTTASVTIKESFGNAVDASQVRAITHLVASSVENLDPEHVVVIDVNGSLLADGVGDGADGGMSYVDNRRAAEMAVAAELQKKVQNILDTSLGPNKAVVQARVTLDWTEKEITTNQYDPESVVLRSSQVITETYQTTGEVTGGVPGADGNLPDGLEADTDGTGELNYARQEETNNYELTQVQTVESITPGEIENISLAVLVDGVTDEQQLASLEAAVAAAAGVNVDRGDIISVESMEFDRSYYEENAADLEETQQRNLYIQIGQYVAVGLLLLVLLWYVQRILGRLRVASSKAWTPVLKPVSEMAGSLSPGMMGASPQPQISKGSTDTSFPELEASLSQAFAPPPQVSSSRVEAEDPQARPVIHAFTSEEKPVIHKPSPEDERLQKIVERLADDDPTNVAEVIRLWLTED